MPGKKVDERLSISLRISCRQGATIARLLNFVRDANPKQADSPVPLYWGDRVTLALDSFWLPDVLSSNGIEGNELKAATLGAIRQMHRHIDALVGFFNIESPSSVPPENRFVWLDTTKTSGAIDAITFRFQPHPGSKQALLLEWIRSPNTRVMHSMIERVCIPLEVFWLPFALRHSGESEEIQLAATLSSISELNKRIEELRYNYLPSEAVAKSLLPTQDAFSEDFPEGDLEQEDYEPSDDKDASDALAAWG